MNRRLYALGRMKSGDMNKTEQAYAQYLEQRRIIGEVAWFRFEGIKLRLADSCFLTMDFAVMLADGTLELHDCKGSKRIWTDDAKVKCKVAAESYPFMFRIAIPRSKKDGGGWEIEEIGASAETEAKKSGTTQR